MGSPFPPSRPFNEPRPPRPPKWIPQSTTSIVNFPWKSSWISSNAQERTVPLHVRKYETWEYFLDETITRDSNHIDAFISSRSSHGRNFPILPLREVWLFTAVYTYPMMWPYLTQSHVCLYGLQVSGNFQQYCSTYCKYPFGFKKTWHLSAIKHPTGSDKEKDSWMSLCQDGVWSPNTCDMLFNFLFWVLFFSDTKKSLGSKLIIQVIETLSRILLSCFNLRTVAIRNRFILIFPMNYDSALSLCLHGASQQGQSIEPNLHSMVPCKWGSLHVVRQPKWFMIHL